MTTFQTIILIIYYLFALGFTLCDFGLFECKKSEVIPVLLLSIFLCFVVTPIIIGMGLAKQIINKLS